MVLAAVRGRSSQETGTAGAAELADPVLCRGIRRAEAEWHAPAADGFDVLSAAAPSAAAALTSAAAVPAGPASFARAGLFDRENYLPNTRVRVAPPVDRPGDPPQYGTLLGHDRYGRAVVKVDGVERPVAANFRRVSPELLPGQTGNGLRRHAEDHSIFYDGIPPERLTAAPPRLLAAVERALDLPIVGTHSAREYIDAFHAAGHRVWLTGGAIRDVLYILHQNPGVSDEVLLDLLKDIDIVVDALPSQVRAVAQQVAPELEGAIWTPESVDRFGFVGIGPQKTGLDVATLRVGQSDRRGAVLGRRLADDSLGRDFTMNQLYIDLMTQQLVDPTGQGVSDAREHLLRVNAYRHDDNDVLPLRYLKFRDRGYGYVEETRQMMAEQAQRHWAELEARAEAPNRSRIVDEFVRIAPSSATTAADMVAHVEELRSTAAADGFLEAYDAYLRPHAEEIGRLFEERRNPS